ncbi:KLTH0G11176p [Lachancea thermotolerans CBS 6340]|uniref:KLTH0G11176p n=1 Tax=Lachancea thermotolerans (strain ATCC 56472 / CBS 6340 / NRRL Y-8284) TaxID=559295 RepID=C5DMS1_LACTC|nr:KLTH0G11176p [Lachancea thermotolerans CBS 6340]CAR25082.1 KLTH0G11176p [Lachancea thermotolerans CBS 6340]
MQAAATITKSGVKHFRKAPRNISWVIRAAYFGFGKPRLRKNVFPYRQVTPRGGVRRAPVTPETSGGPEQSRCCRRNTAFILRLGTLGGLEHRVRAYDRILIQPLLPTISPWTMACSALGTAARGHATARWPRKASPVLLPRISTHFQGACASPRSRIYVCCRARSQPQRDFTPYGSLARKYGLEPRLRALF